LKISEKQLDAIAKALLQAMEKHKAQKEIDKKLHKTTNTD
jgi:uncharacterized protein YejL (UPF0352 family)